MLYQVLPKIEVQANYGRFASRGFGTTVGVALRRTTLFVRGCDRRFAFRRAARFMPIDGAKEDMTMLLLNLKQVRLVL